jgi:hypothetical protein
MASHRQGTRLVQVGSDHGNAHGELRSANTTIDVSALYLAAQRPDLLLARHVRTDAARQAWSRTIYGQYGGPEHRLSL